MIIKQIRKPEWFTGDTEVVGQREKNKKDKEIAETLEKKQLPKGKEVKLKRDFYLYVGNTVFNVWNSGYGYKFVNLGNNKVYWLSPGEEKNLGREGEIRVDETDSKASRNHLKLRVDDENNLFLCDNSTNGTFIDEKDTRKSGEDRLLSNLEKPIQDRFSIKEDINTPESIEKIRNTFSFFKDEILPLILDNPKVTQQKEGYHGLFTHTRNVVFRGICYAVSLGEDPIPVAFACACHDLARVNNGYNKEHGPNAVPVTTEIINNEKFNLTEEEKQQIIDAVVNHTTGMQATNYVSACLRDADRTRLSWERGYKESFFSTEQGKKIGSGKREEFLEFQNLCIGSERGIKKVDNPVKDSDIPDILKSDYHIDEEKKSEYEKLLSRFKYFEANPDRDAFHNWPLSREETNNKVKDILGKIPMDTELLDCLLKMGETDYQNLRKLTYIPQKIAVLRKKYEIFETHTKTIRMYNSLKNRSGYDENFKQYEEYIKNNYNDAMFRYIITYQTDNHLFHNMENDFPLIKNLRQSRKSYNEHIIQNIENYDISLIQDAICDLLFQDNARNIELIVGEMLDREKYVPDFLDKTDKNLLYLLNNLLSLKEDRESISKGEIGKIVKEIINEDTLLEKKHLSLKLRLLALNNKMKSDFGNDLNNGLTQINFDKENHTELSTTTGEKVKFYELRDLDALLVRSIQFKERGDQKGILTKEEYGEFFTRKDRIGFSYSLIDSNSSINNQYVKSDDRALFGFLGIGNNTTLCANTFDGNLSQANGLKMYKQQYFPIKNFLEQTSPTSHNEIYISNEKVKYPDYIISWDNPPKQEKIDLAYKFGIPIVYLIKNKDRTDSTSKYNTKASSGSYDYYSFGYSGESLVSPKCKPVKSISKFLRQF